MVIAEFCTLFFAMTGLILAIVIHEINHRKEIKDRQVLAKDFLNLVCTVGLLISIVIKYNLNLHWLIKVKMYTKADTFRTTGLWKYMLLELILCSISI
jgi:hypothetical protein